MAAKTATTTQERIGRVGQRRQVVIPRDLLETLKLHEGDFVAFSKQANGVLIKPRRALDPDNTLTTAEAKKVRHALKQIREGKTRPWSQIKHELGL
jgi:antitoxin component of MazEF toxin-antitoxin module